MELLDLRGKVVAKTSVATVGKPFQVRLAARVNAADPANYYVRYRFDGSGAVPPAEPAIPQPSCWRLTSLGQREFFAGTSPVVRVMVRDRAAGVPVPGAKVRVRWPRGGKENSLDRGQDRRPGRGGGEAQVAGRELAGAARGERPAAHRPGQSGRDVSASRAACATYVDDRQAALPAGPDDPFPAPWPCGGPRMTPLAGADVLFEVEDAKGNKVFKQPVQADEFGVSHADFVLADELNMGSYRIRAIVAGVKEEKTVTVDRYVLPKFKCELTTDRRFYQPGETVKAELQVNYFFGKAVAGGKVQVKCSKFDVGYFDFQDIEGQTDAKGHFSFEVKLPASFVGQPLEAGKASAKLEIDRDRHGRP